MPARLRALCAALAVLALPLASGVASAQTAGEEPTHNLGAFAPLDLPDPNDYRAASGAPGHAYWQQEADYAIAVTLDPADHTLRGTATITYTNNSPEPLDYLWVQLEQNLFKPGSRGSSVVPAGTRFSGAFEGGGYTLEAVTVTRDGTPRDAQTLVEGTRMRVTLDEPLAPEGGTLDLGVAFRYTIPEYGADRMGRLDVEGGTVYELAQWYPRMYVYDDVHGWNPLPYLGQGEYYLDYGTFDLELTVPRRYIVAATGTLLNPEEVLTDQQRTRLEEARASRTTVDIIAPDEVGTPATRPDGEGPLTWRYRAENVRDVAWTASDAFIWDAAQAKTGADAHGGTALAMSLYPAEGVAPGDAVEGWEESTRYVQHAIEHYSEKWAPYPYPVAINVAGIVRGMEYPQIVFCSVQSRGRRLFGVTDHEFGHEWFPMIVGSDERRWAWMDEGLNSFLNIYSTLAFYGGDPLQTFQRYAELVARATPQTDQPIMTYADRIRRNSLGLLAYRKPATGLMLLREYILGPERFDAAFRAYIDRWAYKHPQPADFFRSIEEASGEDLDWFWRGWFYERAVLDHAITDVSMDAEGETQRVTIASRFDLMMPATLELTHEDGTTERRRVPVEAFFTSDTFTLEVPATVTAMTLDPDRLLPDVRRPNNTWRRADAASEADGDATGER